MITGIEILDRIVATKRLELEALFGSRRELEVGAEAAGPGLPVLKRWSENREVSVIAEVKRRSPGAGDIRSTLDPLALSEAYETGGAAAISVLTDRDYFQGSLGDLVGMRAKRSIPLLRKDFVLDELQILEARCAGADLVLLIVRILTRERLEALRRFTASLGMTALVEAHDAAEVDVALSVGSRLLGINNRDLNTFRTDLSVTEELSPLVPADVVLVAESGIRCVADVERVALVGADAVLIGEALVRSGDPRRTVETFAAVAKIGRGG